MAKRKTIKPLSAATLTHLVEFLLKRSDEAYARGEALRKMLEKYETHFSQTEFDAIYGALLAEKRKYSEELLRSMHQAATSEAQIRLLLAAKATVQ